MVLKELQGRDLEVLERGNDLARRAHILLELARKAGLPGGEENPAHSYLWVQPPRKDQVLRNHCVDHIVDYCAFKARFHARARV